MLYSAILVNVARFYRRVITYTMFYLIDGPDTSSQVPTTKVTTPRMTTEGNQHFEIKVQRYIEIMFNIISSPELQVH